MGGSGSLRSPRGGRKVLRRGDGNQSPSWGGAWSAAQRERERFLVVPVSPPLLNLSDATDTLPGVGAANTSSAITPIHTTFAPLPHPLPAAPSIHSNPTTERPLGTPHHRESESERETATYKVAAASWAASRFGGDGFVAASSSGRGGDAVGGKRSGVEAARYGRADLGLDNISSATSVSMPALGVGAAATANGRASGVGGGEGVGGRDVKTEDSISWYKRLVGGGGVRLEGFSL